MAEAEKQFDEQFNNWEVQFNTWREQNASHPDTVSVLFNLKLCFFTYFYFIYLLYNQT